MLVTDILKLIKSLNSGSIIPAIDDGKSRINVLSNSDIHLYAEPDNMGRYYFFAPYIKTFFEGKPQDNLAYIEAVTYNSSNYESIAPPSPNRSYLILLYEVENEYDVEAVSKDVIQLEENGYLFKKYVFYYSNSEFESFTNWFKVMQSSGINDFNDILATDEVRENIETKHIQFLLRLLVKLPFIKLGFKTSEMLDFDNLVINQKPKRNNTGQQEMFLSLNQKAIYGQKNNQPIDELAMQIIKERMGDLFEQIANIPS